MKVLRVQRYRNNSESVDSKSDSDSRDLKYSSTSVFSDEVRGGGIRAG